MMIDLTPEQIQQWQNETILSGGCWVGILHPGEGGIFPTRHWLVLKRAISGNFSFEDLVLMVQTSAEYQGLAFFLNKSDERPIFSFPFDGGTQPALAGSTFTISSTKIRLEGDVA